MSETFDPFTGTYRQTSGSARSSAITSTRILTKAIKTSYGALGLDKMCISPTGDIIITNDGVTILKNIQLNDPIADLIIELSKQQDIEMGDGTTTVVLLANSLIEKGIELIEKGLHPSIIISGYKMAYKESVALIRDRLSTNANRLDQVTLANITRTSISSKIIEGEHFTDLILQAVLRTTGGSLNTNIHKTIENNLNKNIPKVTSSENMSNNQENVIKSTSAKNIQKAIESENIPESKIPESKISENFSTPNDLSSSQNTSKVQKITSRIPITVPYKHDESSIINILKKEGRSMEESSFLNGYAINAQPVSKMMPRSMENVRICLIDYEMSRVRMPLNVNIICNNPDALEKNRKEEIDISVKRVKNLLKYCDVILSSRNIDDYCIKPIMNEGKIAIKRVPLDDLKTLSKCLNIPILKTAPQKTFEGSQNTSNIHSGKSKNNNNSLECCNLMNGPSENESIDDDFEKSLRDDNFTVLVDKIEVKQLSFENYTVITKNDSCFTSIILRGPNEQILEEMERAVNDGMSSLRKVLQFEQIIPGGGAIEIALSILLERISRNISKKESIAMLSFTECLQTIPKVLSLNSGLDPNEMVSKLILKQMKMEKEGSDCFFYGLNVLTGKIENNIESGIVEPAIQKIRIIRAAVEVAIAILRIDEIIKVPKKTPKQRETCE